MIDGETIAMLIAISGSLVLAISAIRQRQIGFEKGAAMVVAWIVIVAVTALIMGRVMT